MEVGDGTCRVVVDGRVLARNSTSFASNWRGDAWLVYSRQDGIVGYEVPAGWADAMRIRAVALAATGPGQAVPVALADGRIRLSLEAGRPCRLTYARPE